MMDSSRSELNGIETLYRDLNNPLKISAEVALERKSADQQDARLPRKCSMGSM